MKKLLMIGTGGTIASGRTDEGLKPVLTAEDLLSFVPDIRAVCDIDLFQLCNIDSSNMTPKIWSEIARTIRKNYDHYDGFVITHGTDTMAYTAAALSYMIQNSRKPIVLTGSQKPIEKDESDARRNLRDSILYACDDESRDVVLVFDGNVIAGTRAKKMMSRNFNAFHSINFPVLARLQDGRIIRYIREMPVRKRVMFTEELSDSICIMKLIPGSRPEMLSYLFENYDCIIIESFGVGGLPEQLSGQFYKEMKKWAEQGKFTVMATQVVNEGSGMEIYQVGKKVKEDFKIIEAYDMTLEATLTKLMWLLKLYPGDYERIRREFYKEINHDILCGE